MEWMEPSAATLATAPADIAILGLSVSVAWFDILVILVVLVGFRSGKKHGISEELLPVLQWLGIAGLGALLHGPMGRFIAGFTHLSLFWSHLLVYFAVAAVVVVLFIWLKNAVGGKLLESDHFGRHEYSLGILAGVIRYLCMLLVVIAVLNARYHSPAEAAAIERAREKSDVKIAMLPALSRVQSDVFGHSESGKFIARRAGFLLIKATPYDSGSLREGGIGRERERLTEEAIEGPRKKSTPTNAPPATNALPRL
jgi:uncharacterized membrane protein required for colicin V production